MGPNEDTAPCGLDVSGGLGWSVPCGHACQSILGSGGIEVRRWKHDCVFFFSWASEAQRLSENNLGPACVDSNLSSIGCLGVTWGKLCSLLEPWPPPPGNIGSCARRGPPGAAGRTSISVCLKPPQASLPGGVKRGHTFIDSRPYRLILFCALFSC